MILIILTAVVFAIGLYGVLTRRQLVSILASIEVMLGAASVLFIGLATRPPEVQIIASPGTTEAIGTLLIVIFAAEAAVALAIVVAAARATGASSADDLTEVKG